LLTATALNMKLPADIPDHEVMRALVYHASYLLTKQVLELLLAVSELQIQIA